MSHLLLEKTYYVSNLIVYDKIISEISMISLEILAKILEKDVNTTYLVEL